MQEGSNYQRTQIHHVPICFDPYLETLILCMHEKVSPQLPKTKTVHKRHWRSVSYTSSVLSLPQGLHSPRLIMVCSAHLPVRSVYLHSMQPLYSMQQRQQNSRDSQCCQAYLTPSGILCPEKEVQRDRKWDTGYNEFIEMSYEHICSCEVPTYEAPL